MMKQIKKAAKWLLPPIMLLPFWPGYRGDPDGAPRWHRGNYPDWASAMAAAKGYGTANILDVQRAAIRKVCDGQTVYERDAVLFDVNPGSYACRLLAPGATQAMLVVYRSRAHIIRTEIRVDDQVAHYCGMVLQRAETA